MKHVYEFIALTPEGVAVEKCEIVCTAEQASEVANWLCSSTRNVCYRIAD